MLLRRSGLETQCEFNLNAVTDTSQQSGVENEEILRELVTAFVNGNWSELASIRTEATEILGLQHTIDALTVACGFNGITRVANATGIPLDPETERVSRDFRFRAGIDQYDEDIKSQKYG